MDENLTVGKHATEIPQFIHKVNLIIGKTLQSIT